ncbi:MULTISPECIES: STAS/SEC14 domain-containing protein [unclassified Arcicella]|uniref:STAS/SEC14 domain-containing protein n=1 Tax=unclassified Arcicella TaxID=2644986 RepID=UPI00285D343F|nr:MULTISPECIES: STAS/SEC14 domain-containing protein [unclassified Arcicella]MDR6564539.1 hypothetical protein [Arcicella sp. BE51]MDR6825751.1 hypothetical protein [Arcicella sp. BE139]
MVQIETHFKCPVFSMKISEKTTQEDTRSYLSEMSKLISKNERFGLLFDYPEGNLCRERGVVKLETTWFKHYRREFSKQCFGIAIVTRSFFMANVYHHIVQYLAKRTYGCPVNIFETRSDAQRWLMDLYLTPKQ